MPVVQNLLTDAAGNPDPGWALIRLVGPGLRSLTQSEVLAHARVQAGSDGLWSVNLEPNPPESPYYVVTEQSTDHQVRQYTISVPDLATPLWLGDIVVQVPLPLTRSDTIFVGPPGPAGPRGEGGGGSGPIDADAITNATVTGKSVLTAATQAAARAAMQAMPGGVVIWDGTSWGARPAGYPPGSITYFSNDQYGSVRDPAATAPGDRTIGDRWEYVVS